MQIRDFAVKLNNYIMSSVVYFKSQWSEIRSNAATLVGQHLCACFNHSYRSRNCNSLKEWELQLLLL